METNDATLLFHRRRSSLCGCTAAHIIQKRNGTARRNFDPYQNQKKGKRSRTSTTITAAMQPLSPRASRSPEISPFLSSEKPKRYLDGEGGGRRGRRAKMNSRIASPILAYMLPCIGTGGGGYSCVPVS